MSAMTSSVSDNQAHDKKTLPPLSSPPENVCIDDVAASLPSGSGDKDHGHSPPQEKICMDDMLQKYCGEFGRWQQRQFILVSLAWILEAFHSMVMIFADHEPTWRCLSGSAGSGCSTTATSVCHLKPGSWEWVGGRNRSTVSEWGLICGGKFKVGLVQALFFVGCTIGAGIFGHLSDSFLGRKGSLIVACILNTIFGCLTALSPKYWVYALFRTLTGFTVSGVGINVFALANEPVGPSKRGVAGMSTFYFFPSGVAILSAIAYFFQKWRHLYIASSIPSILFVFFVIPFISESPRWYLVRGKINEAMKLMSTIASTNGKHLPSNVILVLDQELASIPNDGKEESFIPNGSKETSPKIPNDGKETTSITNEGSGTKETAKNKIFENKDAISASILDVIRSPATRIRLFLAVDLSFLVSLVYYGLSLNVVNLGVNLYLNVALNSLSELPAFLITTLLLNRLGRKRLALGTMWFSGFFCLIGSLMKKVGVWKVVRMVCGILGIFGMAGTYNLLFIYVAELFPTVVRNVSLGCSAQASQMGAILAPFVVVLGGWMPFGVFAACGIFGGVFTIFLPETLNKPLYDTIAGLEASIV
ncbi:PREDICTED: organic cation/carnitine transporter 4-like isoform X2 [Lupinus angustifolius]|uniref:organic cation/carnitine transporter 4-like isoform X2 n=1 Tax=Lupinus angustifolius TaxID=3871 RepID=UPI00092E6880|nr:PREDICTED: organic cation/carnitine transporter 4-like isoform X2 [Lupinus angustifolius]